MTKYKVKVQVTDEYFIEALNEEDARHIITLITISTLLSEVTLKCTSLRTRMNNVPINVQ